MGPLMDSSLLSGHARRNEQLLPILLNVCIVYSPLSLFLSLCVFLFFGLIQLSQNFELMSMSRIYSNDKFLIYGYSLTNDLTVPDTQLQRQEPS